MMFNRVQSFVYLSGTCLLLATGCSEKDGDTVPAAAKPAANPAPQASLDMKATAPVVAPPGASAAPAAPGAPAGPTAIAASEVSPDTEKALVQLNGILTGTFLAEIGRPPTSVNEFVERGLIRQLPKAPDGQKFFYDPQQNKIVLATRQPGDVDPVALTPEQAQKAYMQTAAEIHKRVGGN